MKSSIRAAIVLAIVFSVSLYTGMSFRRGHVDEQLYPSAALTSTLKLSAYSPEIAGSRADTEIFEFESGTQGGTVLILGGTHCDEPASYIAAYLALENIEVLQGRALIIPRANRSALTHNLPGEAHPQKFDIPTEHGLRSFRMGSRYTNPLDQWPDPEVYVHYPSGQELSGADSRNLNRCYPGRKGGTFTEQIAHAIATFIEAEDVDLVIDLHEASLEYPVINAIVAHERAMDCAANAVLELQLEGLDFALEPSPPNYHGLSHRELGDHTSCFATLMESANVIQGRLRGRTTPELVLTGHDPMYMKAAQIEMTRVPYDSSGISLEVRVGRHLAGMQKLISSFSGLNPEKQIVISGLPSYGELLERKLGTYLLPK